MAGGSVSLRDVVNRTAAVVTVAALSGGLSWLPPPWAAAEEHGSGEKEAGGPVHHLIRYGETLSGIAVRYGVGIREIARANKIRNPDRIMAGRVLVIPSAAPPTGEPRGASTPTVGSYTAGTPTSGPQAAAPPTAKANLSSASGPPSGEGSGPIGVSGAGASGTGAPPAVPASLAPTSLVFEGPGGIRVQVYGILPAMAPATGPGPGSKATGGAPVASDASGSPVGSAPEGAETGAGLAMGPAVSLAQVAPSGPSTGQKSGDAPLFSLSLPEGQRAVALTFNGLPAPDALPGLLRALEGAQARATFFVTGALAREGRDRVLDILARGHEVGVQGQDLADLTGLSPRQVRENLSGARQALLDAGAPPPRFFRPPLGRYDQAVLTAARELGLETAMWSSIGLRDQEESDSARLVEHARAAAFPGAVLMLHPDRPVTVAALPAILNAFGQDGYRVVSLSELVSQATEH